MAQSGFLVARDLDELHLLMSLRPRGPTCVKCDDQTHLQCPTCKKGESCSYTVPVDCSQCPNSYCTADLESGGSGPSAAPIAGGVVGGIAAIAIITYLVWRFLIKPKRSKPSLAIYGPDDDVASGMEKDGSGQLNRRTSTHTVHSIASTVLTRASNIIQIAYIPGVTNRTTPSPNNLVPPVPPIPMQHSPGGQNDQHFFVPGNLRDSTYSGISAFSDRTSYARTSFAPRASIASTIYGKQAQVLTPAQTGMRAKPTVVSVKNGNIPQPPPVPNIDYDKYLRPKSTASTFSVGSTFLNSANTATQARAQVVKLPSSGTLRKVDIGSPSENRPVSTTTLGTSSIGTRSSRTPTVSVNGSEGPFSDPQSPRSGTRESRADGGMSEPKRKGKRDTSPFGDEHATRD